ncbi:MAG: hypothetical protein L0387_15270, partial [Acidobacteria bacterium]|nr:hypothetical protein [Acidobacteriota bacterium]
VDYRHTRRHGLYLVLFRGWVIPKNKVDPRFVRAFDESDRRHFTARGDQREERQGPAPSVERIHFRAPPTNALATGGIFGSHD